MRSVTTVVPVIVALFQIGCVPKFDRVFEEPKLSSVGSGLNDDLTTGSLDSTYVAEAQKKNDWRGGPADFFGDQRARDVGDLVTITVDVNDRAAFNNSSNQSRKSKADVSSEFDFGLLWLIGQGQGEASADGNTSASGQGSISRSERLRFSLSTIVRRVLPNGHLLIEGTQEILVNREIRKVKVSGIVNPKDVSPSNSVDYSKVAEARIYYGGNGQVSDVQKPRWGLQLWDKLSPF